MSKRNTRTAPANNSPPEPSNAVVPVSGAILLSLTSLAGLLSDQVFTAKTFAAMDEFLQVQLFADLSAVSLAAAALVYVLASSKDNEATALRVAKTDDTAVERIAGELRNDARDFLFAFAYALAGIVITLGLDAVFQVGFDPNSAASFADLTGLFQNIPAAVEIGSASLCLVVSLLLMAKGAFGLLAHAANKAV